MIGGIGVWLIASTLHTLSHLDTATATASNHSGQVTRTCHITIVVCSRVRSQRGDGRDARREGVNAVRCWIDTKRVVAADACRPHFAKIVDTDTRCVGASVVDVRNDGADANICIHSNDEPGVGPTRDPHMIVG